MATMDDLPPTPFLASRCHEHGLTRARLRRLEVDGGVRRMLRDVLARADLPDTPALRAQAARLVLPPHVVVADHSAAWLHGVDCYPPRAHQEPLTLEVVSTNGHEPTRRRGILGGRRDLVPSEVAAVDGIPVTTAARTACDLACLRGRPTALAVLDSFMRHHGLTRADFERMLPRFRGRRGVKQLRELIGYASAAPESHMESWPRMIILDDGLPEPECQVWVDLPDHGPVRLDLAYRWWRIAIEYDGEEFHSTAADRARDRRRRAALARAGWVVIVVTKDDLRGPARDAWLARLRSLIVERRAEPTRRYSRGEDWSRRRRY